MHIFALVTFCSLYISNVVRASIITTKSSKATSKLHTLPTHPPTPHPHLHLLFISAHRLRDCTPPVQRICSAHEAAAHRGLQRGRPARRPTQINEREHETFTPQNNETMNAHRLNTQECQPFCTAHGSHRSSLVVAEGGGYQFGTPRYGGYHHCYNIHCSSWLIVPVDSHFRSQLQHILYHLLPPLLDVGIRLFLLGGEGLFHRTCCDVHETLSSTHTQTHTRSVVTSLFAFWRV
jgi:hypothetical protein